MQMIAGLSRPRWGPESEGSEPVEMARLVEENERLLWEVANLASSLNRLHGSRSVQLIDRYWLLRYRIKESLLRFRSRFRGGQSNREKIAHARMVHAGEDCAAAGYDIVLLANASWQWRYQRPQHLATQWSAHGHRVFFVSLAFLADVNPLYRRPGSSYHATSRGSRLWEIHLAGTRALYPHRERMLEGDVDDLLIACQRLQADFDIQQAACIVQFPFWGPLAVRLRDVAGWKVIYDCVDRHYGVFPAAHSVLAEERSVLRTADLVVTTAHLLAEDVQAYTSRVLYIPNAADYKHFAQQLPAALPADLPRSGPIIGYIGDLASWFDVDMVCSTAAQHPEWNFVLIGKGPLAIDVFPGRTNIVMLGEKPFADLPGYLSFFNVCMIPFKLTPVTAAVNPVKFYEYLAAGKPVVATNLPELQADNGLVYLAEAPDQFGGLIARALSEDNETKQLERKSFASRNRWEARYRDYDRAVQELLGSSGDEHQGAVTPSSNDELPAGPAIRTISPSGVRLTQRSMMPLEISIQGTNFTRATLGLLDEQPLATRVMSDTQICCKLPQAACHMPGCYMLSVVDQHTWRQSNRRVFLVREK